MSPPLFNYVVIPPTADHHGIIRILDQSERLGGTTITNNPEYVVDWLSGVIENFSDYLLIYQDTDGQWDGLGVRNGRFDDFVLLKTKDFRTACFRMRNGVLSMQHGPR